MNSGFSKLISHIFVFSLLSLLTVSSFLLWREYESVKNIKNEAILATTKELAKNLSLPVKVFDLAAIDQSIKNSNLSSYTKVIKVFNNRGEALFSNNQSTGKHCGELILNSVPIIYSGSQTGVLQSCVDGREYNVSGIVRALLFIWTLFFIVAFYFWKKSKTESDKLVRIESFIKNIDTSIDGKSQVYIENDTEVAEVYKSIFSLIGDIKEKNDLIEKSKIHEAVSKKAQSIAHDIKSPVGLIRNVLEYDNSISNRSKDKIFRSTEVIQKISDDILDEYKSDGISNGFIKQNLSLTELLENKRLEFKHTEIVFKTDIQWDELSEVQDPLGLVRSISNLVNNSVEAFGEKGGTITLSTQKIKEQIQVQVIDTGPGISEAVMSKLCKAEVTTKPNGNGIGLLTIQSYVDSVGAMLDVKTDVSGTAIKIVL